MAVTEKKYLDLDGLATLISKLKEKRLLVEHSTTVAVAPAAYNVGNDASGHVKLGNPLKLSDIGEVKNIKSGSTTNSLSGTGSVEFKTLNNTSLLGSGNITLEDLGITGAMHFKGTLATLPTASTSDSYNNGDVILVGKKEYVRSGKTSSAAGSWVELGDESSYALKTVNVNAGDGLTGGGAISGDVTISHSKTTAVAPAAYNIGNDVYGHVKLGSLLELENNGAHTHSVTITIPENKVITGVSPTAAKYVWSINKGDDNANVATAVTDVNPTINKLETASIIGVSATPTTASKVTDSKKTITIGNADVGTKVSNIAQITNTTDSIGNANVGNPVTVVTGFSSGSAYKAEYTAASETLKLSALTLATTPVKEAVASTNTITKWATKVDILPAKATSTTASVSNVTISDVTVPVAVSSITVATGGFRANDPYGSNVVSNMSPTTASVLKSSAGISVSTTTGTGTTLVNAVSSTAASVTVSATSSSAGSHAHTFKASQN